MEQRKRVLLLRRIFAEGRRMMLAQHALLSYHKERRKRIRVLLLILCILINSRNSNRMVTRSCRSVIRNTGWWANVWNRYSDARFKKIFRISRSTFSLFLGISDMICYEIQFARSPFLPNVALQSALQSAFIV